MPAKVTLVLGIDRVGKTPLIDFMKQVDPSIIVRTLVPDPRVLRSGDALRIAQEEIGMWNRTDATYVYDRFPIPDDYVYEGQLRKEQLSHFDRVFQALDVNIIFLRPSSIDAYMAKQDHPDFEADKYIDTKNKRVILQHFGRYEEFLSATKLKVARFIGEWWELNDAYHAVEFAQRRLNVSVWQARPIRSERYRTGPRVAAGV